MGLNISIYRVNIQLDDEGYFVSEERVNEQVGWDSLRYAGDTDFSKANLCLQIKDRESVYYRPENFESTFAWINGIVPTGNKNRWIEILNKMKGQPDLYFFFGW